MVGKGKRLEDVPIRACPPSEPSRPFVGRETGVTAPPPGRAWARTGWGGRRSATAPVRDRGGRWVCFDENLTRSAAERLRGLSAMGIVLPLAFASPGLLPPGALAVPHGQARRAGGGARPPRPPGPVPPGPRWRARGR